MERYGSDYWWELSTEKLIGRELRQELNVDDLEKGTVRITLTISLSIIRNVSMTSKCMTTFLEGYHGHLVGQRPFMVGYFAGV